jgi:hypothetical protein
MGKRFYVAGCEQDVDIDLAKDCFERSAEMGYPPAQRLLGVMYLEGDSIKQNYDQARMWLTKASLQNDLQATYFLAKIYAKGLGVTKDWSKAYDLLTSPGISSLPEALELKRRLKSEIIHLYPNLSSALEREEKKLRLSLNRKQHRVIPKFLDPVRTEEERQEFETWLSLNLGLISAPEAFARLVVCLKDYYRIMASNNISSTA